MMIQNNRGINTGTEKISIYRVYIAYQEIALILKIMIFTGTYYKLSIFS